MVTETSYGLSSKLSIPYEEVLPRVKDALNDEGFGALAEVQTESACAPARRPRGVLPASRWPGRSLTGWGQQAS